MRSLAKAVIGILFLSVISCRWTSSDVQDKATACRWQVMELPIFENGSPLGKEEIPVENRKIWDFCSIPENQIKIKGLYESETYRHLLFRGG